MGIPEVKQNKEIYKKIFEVIMTEHFLQLMNDTKPLIQEAQGTLCKKNTKKKKKNLH